MALPTLGQDDRVTRHTPPRTSVGIGQNGHALENVKAFRGGTILHDKRAGSTGPVANFCGTNVVNGPPRRLGSTMRRIRSDLSGRKVLGRQTVVMGNDGSNRLRSNFDVRMIVDKPHLVQVLVDIPATRPSLGQNDGIARSKVVLCAIRVGQTAVTRKNVKDFRG